MMRRAAWLVCAVAAGARAQPAPAEASPPVEAPSPAEEAPSPAEESPEPEAPAEESPAEEVPSAEAAPADAAAPETASFVAGERVLLVSDALDSPLALRTRDELEAMGLFVVLRDDDDILEVVSSARALGAAAAVEVRGRRLDLWADLLVEDGRVAHAVLQDDDEPTQVVALRAAELVRARILRPTRPHAVSSPPPASAAPSSTAVALEGAMGLQGEWAFGEVPPALRVVVAGSVSVEDVVLGVVLAIPTVPSSVSTARGGAELQLTTLAAEVGWRFRPFSPLELTPHARLGAVWIRGVGRSAVGTPARTGDLVVGAASLGARGDWRVQGPVSLWLNAEAGTYVPRPVIGIGGTGIPVGPFVGSVVAGVAVRFDPRAP